MPNNIYKHVQSKLATMVSARAARRALRSALKDKEVTPDNVDVGSMVKVLKGPIFKDFQLILPREGLKQNLGQLISELEEFKVKTGSSSAFKENKRAPKSSKGDIFKDTLPEFWFEDPDDKQIAPTVEKEVKFPKQNKLNSAKNIIPTSIPSPLNEDRLEEITLQFAQLEHVKLVAAIRQKGEVVVSRGSGIDLEMFSRIGLMGLRLLERGGSLRSYYLSHSCGQLFLLILGQDIVVVMGTPELNVGTVFANMSTIKEKL